MGNLHAGEAQTESSALTSRYTDRGRHQVQYDEDTIQVEKIHGVSLSDLEKK